jgi:hypothetical protein
VSRGLWLTLAVVLGSIALARRALSRSTPLRHSVISAISPAPR